MVNPRFWSTRWHALAELRDPSVSVSAAASSSSSSSNVQPVAAVVAVNMVAEQVVSDPCHSIVVSKRLRSKTKVS